MIIREKIKREDMKVGDLYERRYGIEQTSREYILILNFLQQSCEVKVFYYSEEHKTPTVMTFPDSIFSRESFESSKPEIYFKLTNKKN